MMIAGIPPGCRSAKHQRAEGEVGVTPVFHVFPVQTKGGISRGCDVELELKLETRQVGQLNHVMREGFLREGFIGEVVQARLLRETRLESGFDGGSRPVSVVRSVYPSPRLYALTRYRWPTFTFSCDGLWIANQKSVPGKEPETTLSILRLTPPRQEDYVLALFSTPRYLSAACQYRRDCRGYSNPLPDLMQLTTSL